MLALLILVFCAIVSGAPRSIRDVDWKNFSYPLIEMDDVPEDIRWMPLDSNEHVSLNNGRYVVSDECGDDTRSCPLVTLDSVKYGTLSGIGSTIAAVVLTYHSGGTANWQYAYLLTIGSGQPQLLAWLRTGSRASRGLRELSMMGGALSLVVNDPEKRHGDCCSAGTITFGYRWDGTSFSMLGQPVRRNDPPSLDCRKATTAVERLICQDVELAYLDGQVSNAYHLALIDASPERKKTIRRKQTEWFAGYSRTCNAHLSDKQRRACVEQHLSDRLNTIGK